MNTSVPFIGREDELSTLTKSIHQVGSTTVICLVGTGGIGKTALLQEVHDRYHNKVINGATLLVAERMDFDDFQVKSTGSLRRALARALGDSHFGEFLQAVDSWRGMENAGASTALMRARTQVVHEKFIECFNSLAVTHRIVLLFDTLDKVADTEVKDYLLDLFPKLENCVAIVASRTSDEFYQAAAARVGCNVELIEIGPLDALAREQYLLAKEQSLVGSGIDHKIRRNLLALSQGRPIIIDLAVEWLHRENALKWLEDSALQIEEPLSSERLRQLEARLVRHLVQLRSSFDRLILTLSHVHSLDEVMIAQLVSHQEATHLFAEARTYAFVKTLPDNRIALHDEMRRMVEEYVWPEVDPDGSQLRHDCKLGSEYYRDRSTELAQYLANSNLSLRERDDATRSLDAFRLEWLRYGFGYWPDDGFRVYMKLFNEARSVRRTRFVGKLQTWIEQEHNLSRLTSEQNTWIRLNRAKLLNDLAGDSAADAKSILLRLLEDDLDDTSLLAETYNQLGASEVMLGDFRSALRHEERSLDLFRQESDVEAMAIVEDYVGYIYRLIGDWQAAVVHYRNAYNTILRLEDPPAPIIARIFNNLGYALGLMGKYAAAESYCRQAIAVWREAGMDKGVIRGEVTLSTVLRDQGSVLHAKYVEAMELLKGAIQRLSEPEDFELLIRAYFNLAWTQWFYGVEIDSKEELTRALDNFEEARRLAEEYQFWIELPGILHQSSNVYWLLGHKEQARQVNNLAYQWSVRLHDIRYAIDSLLGWAEFDYEDEKYGDVPRYAEQLRAEYESQGHQYPLFYGRMRRIQGAIAFKTGDFDTALDLLKTGIALISQHGGYGMYFINKELQDLEGHLQQLPRDSVIQWIDAFRGYWLVHASKDKVDTLISWCDIQAMKARLLGA